MCIPIIPLKQYLTSAKTLKERIERIDQIINALLIAQLTSISDDEYNPNIQELQLNDGQMIVRSVYRSSSDATKGIFELEKLKQTYMNQLNGRVMTARDIRSLNRL